MNRKGKQEMTRWARAAGAALICVFMNSFGSGLWAAAAPARSPEPSALPSGPWPVMGESMRPSDLLVICPQEVPEAEALCAALTEELTAALAPSRPEVRLLPQLHPAVPPLPEGQPSLRLHLVRVDPTSASLTVRLEGQPAAGALQEGAELTLDVMDAPLSAAQYPSLVRSLLKLNQKLIEAILPYS